MVTVVLKNAAPSSVGRRPQPKSNEFGETTVTLVELLVLKEMLIKAAFSNECCTFLYFKPQDSGSLWLVEQVPLLDVEVPQSCCVMAGSLGYACACA